MAMCLCPLKVDDLLGVLKFNSRDRFRELYLVPLRKSSIVEQTIKDKPNSPDQKYILTTGNPLYLMFLIVYGVDTFLTIIYRLTRHENIFAAHRSHLYQILANESGISHVKVSTAYTLAQLGINLLIIALAGQVALGYQLVVSVGITGGLAALYIFVKGNRVTS